MNHNSCAKPPLEEFQSRNIMPLPLMQVVQCDVKPPLTAHLKWISEPPTPPTPTIFGTHFNCTCWTSTSLKKDQTWKSNSIFYRNIYIYKAFKLPHTFPLEMPVCQDSYWISVEPNVWGIILVKRAICGAYYAAAAPPTSGINCALSNTCPTRHTSSYPQAV